MILCFALSCYLLALVYLYSLTLYRKNGPSKMIGRFSYFAVIMYGLHLVLAVAAFVPMISRHDGTALLVSLAILVSPLILARSFSFRRSGLAIGLQILVLTAGGVWLTVVP